MLLKKGDKIVAKRDFMGILHKGEIYEVVDTTEDGAISYRSFDGHTNGTVSNYQTCFEKYEEPELESTLPNRVTKERIEEILDESNVWTTTVFDKCTIVACQLPNGFVITESSACVSPENYDEDMGFDICIEKIADKIWELEAYKLQQDLHDIGYCDEVELDFDLHLELEDDDEELEDDCESRDDCDECDYYDECNCEYRQ